MLDYEAFIRTLSDPAPPVAVHVALRALWYDANGRDESARRAAESDDSHSSLRVRAYLARKAGDVHSADLYYWKAGAPRWEASLESEWEDIVRHILVAVVVEQAYI